jgi:uncharacterized metal-binding protein YceD (DUF177 family)
VTEFTHIVMLVEMRRRPVRRRIEATPAELPGLAQRLEVRAISRLTADLTVAKRRGTISITGSYEAVLDQDCVVTLEPFTTVLQGEIDEVFAESSDDANNPEIAVDLDTPEPLLGEELDLADLVVQCLALEIDSHPRSPGADIASLGAPAGEADDPTHPFAALRNLQRNA